MRTCVKFSVSLKTKGTEGRKNMTTSIHSCLFFGKLGLRAPNEICEEREEFEKCIFFTQTTPRQQWINVSCERNEFVLFTLLVVICSQLCRLKSVFIRTNLRSLCCTPEWMNMEKYIIYTETKHSFKDRREANNHFHWEHARWGYIVIDKNVP